MTRTRAWFRCCLPQTLPAVCKALILRFFFLASFLQTTQTIKRYSPQGSSFNIKTIFSLLFLPCKELLEKINSCKTKLFNIVFAYIANETAHRKAIFKQVLQILCNIVFVGFVGGRSALLPCAEYISSFFSLIYFYTTYQYLYLQI